MIFDIFTVVIITLTSFSYGYVPLPRVYPQCTHNTHPVCSRTTLNGPLLPWRYNSTVYPNFAGDKSPEAAENSLSKFYPLLSTQCSRFVEIFLCSVYSSACTEFGVVPPCMELCQVRSMIW